MGTTVEELKDTDITRIAGQGEDYAADVVERIDGKYGLAAEIRGRAIVADLIDGAGTQGALSVGTTPMEVKVGASRLANRKSVTIQPTNGHVYWGWTSAVTISTGTKVFPFQVVEFSVADTPVYLVAETNGRNVRVTEGSWGV